MFNVYFTFYEKQASGASSKRPAQVHDGGEVSDDKIFQAQLREISKMEEIFLNDLISFECSYQLRPLRTLSGIENKG